MDRVTSIKEAESVLFRTSRIGENLKAEMSAQEIRRDYTVLCRSPGLDMEKYWQWGSQPTDSHSWVCT